MNEGEFSSPEPAAKSTEKVEKNTLKGGESDSGLSWEPKPINTFDDIHNEPKQGISTFDDIRNKKDKNEIKTFDDLRDNKSAEKETDSEENKNKPKKTNPAQDEWDRVQKEIENTADAEGYRIDEGIKEPVIALNAYGINTGQSCEGHVDSGRSAPWIRIEAPNEPGERFVGQNETFEKVAKKYNMPVEEAKRMSNMDAYWEAIHECQVNGETEEFQKWKEESGKLLYTTKEILDDFYKDREVPENIKIKVDTESLEDMAEGSFEIFNGGEDCKNINDEKLSKDEKEALGERLKGYRKEMNEFAQFIKGKFFTEGDNYISGKRNEAQKKIDDEKIMAVREKIKAVNWKQVWDNEGVKMPNRKEIFSHGEDKNMSDEEVTMALDKYWDEKGETMHAMRGVNIEEFPEVVDKDIRALCMNINKLPFIKTREGCSGHEHDHHSGELSDIGYSEPYLIFYAEENNPEFHKLTEEIDKKLNELKNSGLSGIENTNVEAAEWPTKTEGIREYRLKMLVSPTKEWCEKNGKEYIERPKELGFYQQWSEDNGFPDNEKTQLKWEEAKNKYFEESDKFWKEYGEYFRSDEVKKIRDEFFKVFEHNESEAQTYVKENLKNMDNVEIKKTSELPFWNKISKFLTDNKIVDREVIIIDDEKNWKSIYGSNDSKSSHKPKAIILKKEIFDNENISDENASWLIHEMGHINFYEKLGNKLDEYMEEYHAKGEYTNSAMEKDAFQLQFEFLKSVGKTKMECLDFVEKYIDQSFGESEKEEKEKELEQIKKYLDAVY